MPLRTLLLVLALVPIAVLAGQWARNSLQLYGDWQRQQNRSDATNQASHPVASAMFELQEERRLSGAALAARDKYKNQLRTQRARTDDAVKAVTALPDSGWKAPDDIQRDIVNLTEAMRKLDGYRAAVDGRSASQQQMFDRYTNLITQHLKVFGTLSNVGLADIDRQAASAIDVISGIEMLSREDAYLTRAAASGRLPARDRGKIASWTGAQEYIYQDKILRLLPSDQAKGFDKILTGSAWKEKSSVEKVLLGDPSRQTDFSALDEYPAELSTRWSKSAKQLSEDLRRENSLQLQRITADIVEKVDDMRTSLITTSVTDAAAVLLVALITVLTIRMLRRRISVLRRAALDLQTRLPDVVERMRMGEDVEVDAELPVIDHGNDELGQLGQALNLARHTALDTTVTQVGQFRGFERLLQRIARRTQLLIGLQMKKLTELERKHEDPEVLEGLFDLDHLTARLRRYEENLVILGGGQPQRRWRKPVLLIDVLRSAQSEVQDYRRIQIEVESRVWLTERAVGPVIHALAELMENSVGFSRPPTPVEVYAARVGRGLAVEIEDRGVGMDAEQYDEINRMMADPPRMDVMSRADDVRLGLYVVSRLAQKLNIQVELRPSAFGGTRAVVLIPEDLVADIDGPMDGGPEAAVVSWPTENTDPYTGDVTTTGPVTPRRPVPVGAPSEDTRTEMPYPRGSVHPIDGRHSEARPDTFGAHEASPEPETIVLRVDNPGPGPGAGPVVGAPPRSAPVGSVKPLPRRVRLASLADELRTPNTGTLERPDDEAPAAPRPAPSRSGAAVGAFQRQSRMARRTTPETDHDHGSGGAVPPGTRFLTED